jgi:putative acetyltransferase
VNVRIENVDPQGDAALALLREAVIDVRPLYPQFSVAKAPAPTNDPLPVRGVYVIAYVDGLPLGCGALRPLGEDVAEVRRMYVHRDHRRLGIANIILRHLIGEATQLGYSTLRLETGNRQAPAIALYESFGFRPIAPFGEYLGDPTSVCYELRLGA